MSRTIKRIWIVYAVLSVLFGLYAISEDGDVFAWLWQISLLRGKKKYQLLLVDDDLSSTGMASKRAARQGPLDLV